MLALAGLVLIPSCASTGNANSAATKIAKQDPYRVASVQQGKASWYSIKTNYGTKTASGERLSNNAPTAAHKTLPMGTKVRVINMNNRQVRGRHHQRPRPLHQGSHHRRNHRHRRKTRLREERRCRSEGGSPRSARDGRIHSVELTDPRPPDPVIPRGSAISGSSTTSAPAIFPRRGTFCDIAQAVFKANGLTYRSPGQSETSSRVSSRGRSEG